MLSDNVESVVILFKHEFTFMRNITDENYNPEENFSRQTEKLFKISCYSPSPLAMFVLVTEKLDAFFSDMKQHYWVTSNHTL